MITLELAHTRKDKQIADDIIKKYHSYVNTPKVVGRVLKYIIKDEDEIVGTIWLGSGFKPTPKAILDWLGINQQGMDKIFNSVADNKRFCLIKHKPNLGSQALSLLRKRSIEDWYNTYDDILSAIVTTIGDNHTGAVYRADNWEYLGKTSGLPQERKSVSMKWNNTDEIKERYVRPVGGSQQKLILGTKRLG